jgi:hypothetical protein
MIDTGHRRWDGRLRGVTQPWQPVARLDPYQAIDAIASQTGMRLTYDGPCPGGEVGAAYVRRLDGRRSVLTRGQRRSARITEVARAAGIPAPAYEIVADVDGGTVVVQELLPGTPPAGVDETVLAAMLDVHDRFAGLLRSEPGSGSGIRLYLRASGPGFCLHEPLDGYDKRTRRLLAWVRDVGEQRDTADGDDLVHVDFHPGNMLLDGGRLTGVVDWDGAGCGDRHLDLVTLRFDVALRAPGLLPALDDLLTQTVTAGRLRAYWAHMSLRLVDWAIRHHGPADVDFWLATAEPGLRL